jgi:hypothetical protein
MKLRIAARDSLGTFEALEFLELGVQGKVGMWRALSSIVVEDTRLSGLDYEFLAARAEQQAAKVEQRRMEAARLALLKDSREKFIDGKSR